METIFFINNCIGARLLFDSVKLSLADYQRAFYATSLSEAINNIKDYSSEMNKIVISDDWYNDFTEKKATELDDFIYAKEKLSLFINSNKRIVKWCFLIDAPYYKGSITNFINYCSKNKIEFVNVNHSSIDEFTKFIRL